MYNRGALSRIILVETIQKNIYRYIIPRKATHIYTHDLQIGLKFIFQGFGFYHTHFFLNII